MEEVNNSTYDLLFKLLMIGDSAVGKTCMLFRYTDDVFEDSFISTIGIDFKVKTVMAGNKRIKLQIWDTAGQERFRTITTAYYRGAMGFLIVYDVTNEESFFSVKQWIDLVKRNAEPPQFESGETKLPEYVELVLCGNKTDLTAERVVSYERGKALASEYGLRFFETSAKDNVNLSEAFAALVDGISGKIDKGVNFTPMTSLRDIKYMPHDSTYKCAC